MKLVYPDLRKGSRWSEEELRRLYALHRQHLRIKPAIGTRASFATFEEDVQRAALVTAIRASASGGEIEGYAVLRDHAFSAGKENVYVVECGYFVCEAEYRRHPACVVALLGGAARLFAKHPTARKYLLGASYPSDFIRLDTLFHPARTWVELADTFDQLVFRKAARHFWGERFDEAVGTVELRTLPLPWEQRIDRTDRQRLALDKYESLNPRWREGFGLVVLSRVGRRTPVSWALLLARRLARRFS